MNSPSNAEADRLWVAGGGDPLRGTLSVPGSKNAAMPLLAAAALSPGRSQLSNVPALADVRSLLELLHCCGTQSEWSADSVVLVPTDSPPIALPSQLMGRLRGSIYAAAVAVIRTGHASFANIGGDVLAGRSIEPHLRAFAAMGHDVAHHHGVVTISSRHGGRAAEYTLGDRAGGITASALALILATHAPGRSVIAGISWEPEVRAVAAFLRASGAELIEEPLRAVVSGPVTHTPRDPFEIAPDRVIWGTYAIAAAVTGGSVDLPVLAEQDAREMLAVFEQAGVKVTRQGKRLTLSGRPIRPVEIEIGCYPSYPPDLAPITAAFMAAAPGRSILHDRIHPARYDHLAGLCGLGVRACTNGPRLIVDGGHPLRAGHVTGAGIRETAALIVAGLMATGRTRIDRTSAVYRGYPDLPAALRSLGAQIEAADAVQTGTA